MFGDKMSRMISGPIRDTGANEWRMKFNKKVP